MEEKRILFILQMTPAATAVLVFALFHILRREYHPERLVLTTWREIAGFIRKKERESGWYRNTQQWLDKNGAAFHYGSWVEPGRYLALRTVLALLGLAAVGSMNLEGGVVAAVLLFFLPGWLLLYLNGRDNERLLPELKLVYHALEIQIRAGVYVTDALAECYGSVRERRLREALLALAGDIVMKADIFDALERFQGKFDNRYVDALCITVLQALESGQALELLGDIGEQVKDMEGAVLERRKGALDRSITFYQLGILAVVLGVALYACVMYMFGAAAGL
ncbi:MAG: hypothetical protein J1E01_08885 [Acetatifactor sp.]|nr:hypothetical protein [Acetatifactor sp.]